MTMTDPIADMLTRLRNANQAYHDSVSMPYSKIKARIAEILQQEGYITGWKVEDAEASARTSSRAQVRPQPRALASPASSRDLQARPARVRQAHRPAQGARRPRRGDHLHVQGLLTDRQASKKGVGGEVLAYVW